MDFMGQMKVNGMCVQETSGWRELEYDSRVFYIGEGEKRNESGTIQALVRWKLLLVAQPAFDPWNKVRPVLDAVNFTFKKHYWLHNICQSMRAYG